LRQRDRAAETEDPQSNSRRRLVGAAVKVDAERMLRRQRLDQPDIGERGRRRIDFAIVDRKRLAVAGEQPMRRVGLVTGADRLFEPLAPALDDGLDATV